MTKITLAALVVVLSLGQAGAAPSAGSLTFVGDTLVAKYDSLGAGGGLIEFVPADEAIENWTRLVGYRAFLDTQQSAAEAAAALARQTRQLYPRDSYPDTKITVYGRGAESIVEISLVKHDATIEYNVFRYASGSGGRGLVSLQYARRLRGSETGTMSGQAARWAKQVAEFDMNRVRAAFGPGRPLHADTLNPAARP